MKSETLAHKLGTTMHVSPLLMKARRLGLHGAEDLERLAIRRGCRYYDLHGDSMRLCEDSPCYGGTNLEPSSAFSNEELAVALLSICLADSQYRLRVGAAMLGAEGNSPSAIGQLATRERCNVVVRYVARCGFKVEPENPFWKELLASLPDLQILPSTFCHI